MFKFYIELLAPLSSILLVPVSAFMAPLCMISSSLFQWMISWFTEAEAILVSTLAIEWTVSVLMICELVLNRRCKSIFFYEFVFFLVCTNSAMIGFTYSLMHRSNFIEELTAKICTSLMLILVAETLKIKIKCSDQLCTICLGEMKEDECMRLKCRHVFHENCLWDWAYIKTECPCCRKAFC